MALKDLVGARIKQARTEMGLSQTQAANALGISQTVWSDYEKGKTNVPFDTLERIVALLNKPPEFFVMENYEYMARGVIPQRLERNDPARSFSVNDPRPEYALPKGNTARRGGKQGARK